MTFPLSWTIPSLYELLKNKLQETLVEFLVKTRKSHYSLINKKKANKGKQENSKTKNLSRIFWTIGHVVLFHHDLLKLTLFSSRDDGRKIRTGVEVSWSISTHFFKKLIATQSKINVE